jgi:hypothetical protein
MTQLINYFFENTRKGISWKKVGQLYRCIWVNGNTLGGYFASRIASPEVVKAAKSSHCE